MRRPVLLTLAGDAQPTRPARSQDLVDQQTVCGIERPSEQPVSEVA